MGTANERRTAVRYQLRAPVIFKAPNGRTDAPGAGFVQNISTEGVFVLSPARKSAGELIDIEILLPPFGTCDAELVVRYTGLIVRVEESHGFAVAAKVSLHRYVMGGHVSVADA
jgi:PilZ domain